MPSPPDSSRILQAYRFFAEKIGEPHGDRRLDLEHLERVVVSGIEVVSITLGEAENEYRIFESLNAKGRPLTQADLLRNYIFMRIPAAHQEQTYRELWLPMQANLGDAGLADFFRHLESIRQLE